MHSLEAIHSRNDQQVHKELREALADGDLGLARAIAKANPDLYAQNGQRRYHVDEDGDVRYQDDGGEA